MDRFVLIPDPSGCYGFGRENGWYFAHVPVELLERVMSAKDPKQVSRLKHEILVHVEKGIIFSLLKSLEGINQGQESTRRNLILTLARQHGYYVLSDMDSMPIEFLVGNLIPVLCNYQDAEATNVVEVDSRRMPEFS